ncbi:MAG TPA: cytochrome c [Bryobacteraceae bacterium]|jgi:mono/diheme cytochrome c family protein|nr:cytochrome c [Bryobacteraceae bacterium]
MKRLIVIACVSILPTGCSRLAKPPVPLAAKAFGAAIAEVGGGKQVAGIGAALDQLVVVQVNDAQGSPVAGALVELHTAGGAFATPDAGLTGADGQLTSNVTLGGSAGRYQIMATTRDKSGKPVELPLDEIALGYQQQQGRVLNDQYCARCHDPESTPERVSNHDNLTAKPHAFTEGAVLNVMSDADLAAMIGYGGPALNKSPEMPPYGYTLNKPDVEALIAYIRAVADPPYRLKGLTYAKN